jgi:hypothetical protein
MDSAPAAAASTAPKHEEAAYPRYDDTNLFELVNHVCDLTARDLKNHLSIKGTYFTVSRFPVMLDHGRVY